MPPLAAAVAMLGAILMAEKCVSSWILGTYPAERELMPYARLVDDPTCLAMARATEIAVEVGGEIAAADPVALERCPQLLETYPTPKPLAEQLVAAPRPDTDAPEAKDECPRDRFYQGPPAAASPPMPICLAAPPSQFR